MDDRRFLAFLVDFARTLTEEFSLQQTLDHAIDGVLRVLPVTGAGVLVMGSEEDHHLIAATDDVILFIVGLQVDLGEGPCLEAYRTGQHVAVKDLAAPGPFPRFAEQAAAAGLDAVYSFPLRSRDEPIGALELYSTGALELTDEDLRGAQTLADIMAGYLANAQARSAARASVELLEEIALHDSLTGLPNRLLLDDRLRHAMRRSKRDATFIGVLSIDVDRLKIVNDTLGHQAGDDFLQALTARVLEVLRPGDTFARVSGDEFVILCEALTSSTQAQEVADRILRSLDEPLEIGSGPVDGSVSIGIAFAGPGRASPDRALELADAALYEVKHRGGGGQHVATMLMSGTADRNRTVGLRVRNAIEGDELHLEYQPIVDAVSGAWSGVEALLRWAHPQLGALDPMEILAAADRTGNTLQLATWVLETSCRDMRRWAADPELDGPPLLAVNVSVRELLHPQYVTMVRATLEAVGLAADQLCLEVKGGALSAEDTGAGHALRVLCSLGVTIAYDDFGTGPASLTALTAWPVSTVKINRSYAGDMTGGGAPEQIIKAVIDLSRALQISVVTQGLETDEQLDHVLRLGTDHYQGHLVAPPLRRQAFEQLMLARALLPDPAAARFVEPV
jgi:diguanylate cyclase (GGDEF)-like protein